MVLSLKITSCKNIINYRIGRYAKHGRMVTNSPRNKNFQWFGAGNGLGKRKNSRKANVGLRFSGEKIRASVVLSYRLNELLTYRVNNVRHSATRSIRIWIYRWYSARRRCLFSLFAGTVFQERHCVPVPLRMCRYGKRG